MNNRWTFNLVVIVMMSTPIIAFTLADARDQQQVARKVETVLSEVIYRFEQFGSELRSYLDRNMLELYSNACVAMSHATKARQIKFCEHTG